MAAPAVQVDESLKLSQDGEVVFFEIALKNIPNGGQAVVRFRDGPEGLTTVWNGNRVWDHFPCQITGQARSAEASKSRPTLRLVNPLGIFNDAAMRGQFDGAVVQKSTVMASHVKANLPIADVEIFFIGRVKDLVTGQSISFELRYLSDGPEHLIPARMYTPDAGFNFVTL